LLPDDLHLRETKIASTLAFEGCFLKVASDTVALPNGVETVREYVLHPGAAVVLPVFDDGSILMERQFRYPLNRVFIEFPAGKIDHNEATFLSAQRELEEETGYTASDWQFVCTIHNAIAYSDEFLNLYLARGLKEGRQRLDDGEFLEVYRTTLPELLEGVRQGQITDVKTVIGIFWLEKILSGQWAGSPVGSSIIT
jgi:ADP-ribose pyrophosphatase